MNDHNDSGISLRATLWGSILSLLLWAVIFTCLSWLTSCTALMSHEPVTRFVVTEQTPDAAYRQAIIAFARLGGEVRHTDYASHTLSGVVHNAVTMTVIVSPEGTGSRVEVTGSLLPNKVAIGAFDEVDQFSAMMR